MRTLFTIVAVVVFAGTASADTVIGPGHDAISVETFDEETDRGRIRRTVTVQSRIDDGRWTKTRALYPLSGQDVSLRVKKIIGGEIRWYMIFADLTRNYNNANPPFEPRAYEWIGFDKILYHRVELVRFRGAWEIHPFSGEKGAFDDVRAWFRANGKDGYELDFYNDDAGTFWFQAEVERKGKTTRSWGIEDSTDRGLSPRVMRVSFRRERGYLGYLTSFYNVPGLFGSVLYQSKNHLGADCADVLMAAWSKWKRKPLKKNFNVSMLVDKFRKLAQFEMKDGNPDVAVKWKELVRPGDFIAVRYGDGGKKFHHIGALYRDANSNGLLDAEDLVIHAGPDPLHLSRLKHNPFDGHVVILRP